MRICIIDGEGNVLVPRDINRNPEEFLRIIAPYREAL